MLFVPYILAMPIIAVVMKKMFQFNGPVNEALRWLGADFLALDWIGSSDYALWTVMLLIIWRESALGIILFLARLLNLDESLIEAARLDGANWWQRAALRDPAADEGGDRVLRRGQRDHHPVLGLRLCLHHGRRARGAGHLDHGGRALHLQRADRATSLPGIASAVSVLLFLVSLLLIVPLFAVRRRANEEEVG